MSTCCLHHKCSLQTSYCIQRRKMCCSCYVQKSLCGCDLKNGCLVISALFLITYIALVVIYCIFTFPGSIAFFLFVLVFTFFIPLLMPILLLYGTIKGQSGVILASLILLWYKIIVLCLATVQGIFLLINLSAFQPFFQGNLGSIIAHYYSIFIAIICICIFLLGKDFN